MIIIAENKKNHYLIKNFYDEINKQKLKESRLNQRQGGEHTALNLDALDNDDTVVDYPAFKDSNSKVIHTDKEEDKVKVEDLQIAAKLKPKMKKILNIFLGGLTVSSLAAGMFFNSNLPQDEAKALEMIASQNKVSVEKVKEVEEVVEKRKKDIYKELSFSEDERDFSKAAEKRRYAGPNVQRSDETSLYNFESSTWNKKVSKPYPDAGGLSIGYGTQLFADASKSKNKDWRKVFFEEKLGNKPTGNPKTVERDGQIVKISSISSITEKEARKAADAGLKIKLKEDKKEYPWLKNLPGDAQLAFVDMTYNMGTYFNMEGFKSNMESAAEFIAANSKIQDKDEFFRDVDTRTMKNNLRQSINYLKEAILQLAFVKPPAQIDYEGSNEKLRNTAYKLGAESSDVASSSEPTDDAHRRASNSIQRIRDAIFAIEAKIKNIKEHNSLKKVYNTLYS